LFFVFDVMELQLIPLKRHSDRPRRDNTKLIVSRRSITEEAPSTEPWLQITRRLLAPQLNDRHSIFTALLHQQESIVVKIGSTGSLLNEYGVGSRLASADIRGFIRYLHYFECETSKVQPGCYLGQGPGDKMKVLVMPHYPLGDLRNWRCEEGDWRPVKSALKQACFALIQAHVRLGLVYNDAHTANVLLRHATPEEATVAFEVEEGSVTVCTHGLVAEWVDFENCILPPEGAPFPLHRSILLFTIQQVLVDCGFRCKGYKIENILDNTQVFKNHCEGRHFTPETCAMLADLIDGLEFVAK
jgi:hypothetical protein